jgi:hypothetical protein
MPTTLPNSAAQVRRYHRPLFAEFASIAVAILYLFLLAWNLASLETSFSRLFEHDLHQGGYNPMELSHPIARRSAASLGAR